MNSEQLLQFYDAGAYWPAGQGLDTGDSLPEAYQLTLAVRSLRQQRGEQPRGYKIGFTNRNIWPRYQVFAPIWGTVWDKTLVFCEGAGSLDLRNCCEPRLKPEMAFGFARTPAPNAGLAELFDALAWVAPAFEVVQTPRPDWKFTAAETVAHGALHARLLVGCRVPVKEIAADSNTLRERLARTRVRLSKDNQAVEEGVGANVLDSPLDALLHFLSELRACPGAPDIKAGDVVTTGTLTDAWPVQTGENWRAEFDAPIGALTVRFVSDL